MKPYLPKVSLPVDGSIEPNQDARLIQELLVLAGYNVSIDGLYGPATRRAVVEFQRKNDLLSTGVVDALTFALLKAPLDYAVSPLYKDGRSLPELVIAYAKQHLAENPREVGGNNRGPWVRMYMDGNEGEEMAWCAGFVTFIIAQTAETLGMEMPVLRTFSCDDLAQSAKMGNRFISSVYASHRKEKIIGGLFLSKGKIERDWVHTGIVIEVGDDYFVSIEGNTNEAGYRDGDSVKRKIRSYKNRDFITLA